MGETGAHVRRVAAKSLFEPFFLCEAAFGFGQERFPGMTITYALIQMLEKVRLFSSPAPAPRAVCGAPSGGPTEFE